MTVMDIARISFAAIFEVDDFGFRILQRDFGAQSRLFIQVSRGVRSAYYQPPLLLTYWGPLQASAQSVGRSKPLRLAVREARDQPQQIASVLKEIVDTYGSYASDSSDLEQLREKLSSDAQLINFVDGEESESSDSLLTLASAQDLGEKVRRLEQLSERDLQLVKILLTQAPLEFGFWGPFKTLMKFLDPKLVPIEFGQGLSRLSQVSGFTPANVYLTTRGESDSNAYEEISWLKTIIAIPSSFTVNYMAKRMRRQLEKLGKKDARTYSIVSANMLIAWDDALNSRSFIAAYILGGAERVLNKKSRLVSLPLLQDHRRDAHPAAWDKSLDQVQQILNSVATSSEIVTFCLQVLKDNCSSALELNARIAPLALLSSDTEVVDLACAALPNLPNAWEQMSFLMWDTFFSVADSTSLQKIAKQLLSHSPEQSVARAVLYSVRNQLVSDDDPIADVSRLAPIGQLYLAFSCSNKSGVRPWQASDLADARAIEAVALLCSFDKLPDSSSVYLKDISLPVLLKVYLRLLNRDFVPAGNLQILLQSILLSEISKTSDVELIDCIIQCFETVGTSAVDLGWLLLERCIYRENAEERIWEWLNQAHESQIFAGSWSQRRMQLINDLLKRCSSLKPKLTELLTDSSWSLTKDDKSGLLGESRESLRIAWDVLGQSGSGIVKDILLADRSLLIALGESLSVEDLTTSDPLQHELLQQYVLVQASRIQREHAFGVALAAIPEPTLQESALGQLKKAGALSDCWLVLAELSLPLPLATVRDYIESITDRHELTECVIACSDSAVVAVRDMGLELLDQFADHIDNQKVWSALSTSDDPMVQARVAEWALVCQWEDLPDLATFDRRVLVTRRVNRRSKEKVKERLSASAERGAGDLLAPQRRQALLDMAKGANSRDREWALRRIAILALQGVPFDEIQVTPITAGRN